MLNWFKQRKSLSLSELVIDKFANFFIYVNSFKKQIQFDFVVLFE